MVDSKRSKLPDFAKNVLQTSARTREQAAWELLSAVRDLFPDRFRELKDLANLIPFEFEGDPVRSHADVEASRARFRRAVRAWSKKNKIACEVVNHVAEKRALGNPIDGGLTYGYINEHGKGKKPPCLWVDPFTEEVGEFLRRARRFYNEVVTFYQRGKGTRPGPIKRNLDHFRWLAANLIGNCSYSQIADGDNPFGLSGKSDKTVAGECRKLAELIGVPLTDSPGPRRGQQVRKAAVRVRPNAG